jgi:hypothetical protein
VNLPDGSGRIGANRKRCCFPCCGFNSENHPEAALQTLSVIASAAKQSRPPLKTGLLRCARNDDNPLARRSALHRTRGHDLLWVSSSGPRRRTMVPCLVECVRGMISCPRASAPRSGPVTDALCPESKPTLDGIAKLLREKADLRLDVIGHTDNRGTPNYNICSWEFVTTPGGDRRRGADPRLRDRGRLAGVVGSGTYVAGCHERYR